MLNTMKKALNMKNTENGAVAYSSTLNKVYDMFALGASYRARSDEEVIELFENAFNEDETLTIKCLFWIRDARGGAGERRFFRVCMQWLAYNYPDFVKRNLEQIPEFGRWDDLYVFVNTPLEKNAMQLLAATLDEDMIKDFPSLAAKWAKSVNASSWESRRLGRLTAKYWGISEIQYRHNLSKLRTRLNVLERLMSSNRWNEIEFDKIPSVAGLRYSHCFANRDELKERYYDFMNSKDSKVNANVLYPYECACKANKVCDKEMDDPERVAVNKYWENLPDYIGDNDASNFMCVCDTSGSMTWAASNPKPIDVATSLSIYFAERAKGPFHNHYISFASRPQLIEIKGKDFVDKVCRIRDTDLCDNTDLEAVFEFLLKIAKSGEVRAEDFVKNLFIISDMEIDTATAHYYAKRIPHYTETTMDSLTSTMEQIRKHWERQTSIPFPKLYYWNVNARNNTVLDMDSSVSYISGASPAILKQVLSGKTGWELCLETLLSERYEVIY